jgi:hypothetical protein
VKKNWFVSDPTIVLFPSILDGFFDSISPFFFFLFVFQILRLSAREENVRKMITIPSERAR